MPSDPAHCGAQCTPSAHHGIRKYMKSEKRGNLERLEEATYKKADPRSLPLHRKFSLAQGSCACAVCYEAQTCANAEMLNPPFGLAWGREMQNHVERWRRMLTFMSVITLHNSTAAHRCTTHTALVSRTYAVQALCTGHVNVRKQHFRVQFLFRTMTLQKARFWRELCSTWTGDAGSDSTGLNGPWCVMGNKLFGRACVIWGRASPAGARH